MASAKFVVQVVGGTIRNNLWCDACATTGRFEIDMHALSTQGQQSIGMVNQCTRCDYTDPDLSLPDDLATGQN